MDLDDEELEYTKMKNGTSKKKGVQDMKKTSTKKNSKKNKTNLLTKATDLILGTSFMTLPIAGAYVAELLFRIMS